MLAANGGHAAFGGFAGLGEGVVAGVEVFALFELVLKEIFLIGQLAIEAKQLLLLLTERTDIDFVLLVRIHDQMICAKYVSRDTGVKELGEVHGNEIEVHSEERLESAWKLCNYSCCQAIDLKNFRVCVNQESAT